MRPHHHTKTLALRDLSYLKGSGRLVSTIKFHPFLCDVVLIALAIGLAVGFFSYFHRFFSPLEEAAQIDLSLASLPKYTFYSMSRGLLAFCLSLIFSLVWGFWTAKDRLAERFLIPGLDILQSIPILGFMPGLILLMVGLFPKSNIGLELASILMLFTSQAWNMAFGVYHALRIIPQDEVDCARTYRLSSWQRIKWLEIPCTLISLIWNSIMSMAGGWFFLMVNEAFRLGDRNFMLPGLGSFMSVAAGEGDVFAMIWAILAMIMLIVFLDYFLWRPLIVWSQKFRVESTGSSVIADSFIFQVMKHSFLVNSARKGICNIGKSLPKASLHFSPIFISRTCLALFLTLSAIGLFTLITKTWGIPWEQWMHLLHMTFLTFGRVITCIVIGTCLILPLGLAIGLSDRLSKRLEPAVQIAASFPATLLFPMLIVGFHYAHIPLGIGSVLLMLIGSQWYILFNVMAGTKAMPSDLREALVTFRLRRMQRFFSLYLPAIFPYLITGLIAAAGGAWNASIVAEFISYRSQEFSVPGIGSTISLSAQNGDIPTLIASILIMSSFVVLLNYQVWLRLYHYSEKRFSLS